MTLTERIQSKITKTYHRLNQRGITPGGRFTVNLEVWAPGTSANKAKKAEVELVPDSELPVVVMDLKIGEVKRWDDQEGVNKPIGDARMEIARNQPDDTPITWEQITGADLEPGQELRARIDDVLYSVVTGNADDPADGYTWQLVLRRL